MRRRYNHQLVKTHFSYSVDEIARLLDAHKNTVRDWFRRGLRPIDDRRPALVHGRELRRFHEHRRALGRQTCKPGEFFCLPCRAPKQPAGAMADYIAIAPTSGNLKGICPDCDGWIYRRVTRGKLDAVRGNLEIAFPQAPARLGERADASVNCDFNDKDETDEGT